MARRERVIEIWLPADIGVGGIFWGLGAGVAFAVMVMVAVCLAFPTGGQPETTGTTTVPTPVICAPFCVQTITPEPVGGEQR